MRHAYLLLVHKNQKQIELLLELLDIEENDIYVHVDIKSKDINKEELKKSVHRAGLFFVESTSVLWGDYSIVNATIILLEEALKKSHSYYHLLSGQDMPLKPIREINMFYDNGDLSSNYISFGENDWQKRVISNRIIYRIVEKIHGRYFRAAIRRIVSILPWDKMTKVNYSAGSAWFDINEELARTIVDSKDWIFKKFKNWLLPDEAFLQTFVTEKGIKQTCKSSMRRIDWERSPNGKSPYVFRLDDYEMLINSGMNFGRKFDMDVDKEIINKIYNDFIKHLR